MTMESDTRGQRSARLYSEEDMERVVKVLNQSIYAAPRREFSLWRLLGWLGLLVVTMAVGSWLTVAYLV